MVAKKLFPRPKVRNIAHSLIGSFLFAHARAPSNGRSDNHELYLYIFDPITSKNFFYYATKNSALLLRSARARPPAGGREIMETKDYQFFGPNKRANKHSFFARSLAHLHTSSLARSLVCSLARSLAHSLTCSLTRSLIRALAHPPIPRFL